MSVIDKLESKLLDYDHDLKKESRYGNTFEALELRTIIQATEEALEIVKADPAYTAREKAKRVAKYNNLQEGTVVYWGLLDVVDDGISSEPKEIYCWMDETGGPQQFMNDLTPTPKEIATGCCCYVVLEKGETDVNGE